MQEQRNSVESIPEPFQIDCGSNSNSAGMDQPFYGNNILLNSVETPTLADYLLSSNDTDMDYLNTAAHRETDGLNIWNSTRDPNSSAYVTNQENHDATKIDHVWNTSLSINSAGGQRMEERQCERNNILSLEHVGLNLNNAPADDGQAFTNRLSSNHVNQRMDHNMHVDSRSEIMELSSCPFFPEFFEPEHIPYTNSNGSSSSGVGHISEDVDRPKSSVDVQRIACKRKSMEGVIGESSTSHNITDVQRIPGLGMPSSSRYLPEASFLEVNQGPGFNPMTRGVCSEWNSTLGLSGNAETSQRSFRARLNPPCQLDMPHFQSHSSVTSERLSSIWSSGDQSAEQSQAHLLLVPGLPHNINNSSSTSRMGSSSLQAYPQRRLIASPEEANIRSLPRNSIVDQPAFLTSTTVSHLGQDPPNWNPSNSSLVVPGNRASSSSGVIPVPGSIRAPSEIVPAQYHRNFSEVLRNPLFLSGRYETGYHDNSFPSRQSGRPASVQEPGQSSRTVRQSHSPLYPRPAVSIDRQRDGVSGLPLSARSRDGRTRMLSEVC